MKEPMNRREVAVVLKHASVNTANCISTLSEHTWGVSALAISPGVPTDAGDAGMLKLADRPRLASGGLVPRAS